MFRYKKFYLNNPIPGPEYMKMNISMIPQEVIDQYNIEKSKDNKGWCYTRIHKGMYVLKQAGIITNNELQKHLKPYGYAPVRHTTGLWECKGRDKIFTLVVDNVLVNITSEECVQHITNALKEKYEIIIDWDS